MDTIITLTTDFGHKDYFVGAIKGKIISQKRDCQIVDITHGIEHFNISQAGYVIAAAYPSFPKGSIHLIGVDAELTPANPPIAMLLDGHYFIAADNGILSFLTKLMPPEQLIEIHPQPAATSMSIFVDTAIALGRGCSLSELGSFRNQLLGASELQAVVSKDQTSIRGNIIYEDHFGNTVTNITQEVFDRVREARDFTINVKNRPIKRINKYFSDFNITESTPLKAREGELLAIFNELGYLQFSLYRANPITMGSPRTLLGLEYRDTITVEFIPIEE